MPSQSLPLTPDEPSCLVTGNPRRLGMAARNEFSDHQDSFRNPWGESLKAIA